MEERLLVHLESMRHAAQEATDFVDGLAKEDFLEDALTQKACALNLILIGESAKRILERHSEMVQLSGIAWKEIAAMRNRIAHDYYSIDLNTVWDTISNDLPGLITQIDELLSQ